jgi:ATP-dependent phosphofructokinase / diphosphate-dependent phosphofructokinase
VSAVINASACGVIETARKYPGKIGKLYAGPRRHRRRAHRGSDRHEQGERRGHPRAAPYAGRRIRLGALQAGRNRQEPRQYERLIEVFKAHDIGYFFYNGGNDSMDTAHKVSEIGQPGLSDRLHRRAQNRRQRPAADRLLPRLRLGREVHRGLDARGGARRRLSMARTSTKVFVLEVMGRHAGWIAPRPAALPGEKAGDAPHIILFPKSPSSASSSSPRSSLRREVRLLRDRGLRGRARRDGKFLAEAGTKDAFGHAQLGGVGPVVAR